jgi:putative ABC transport system permease protein
MDRFSPPRLATALISRCLPRGIIRETIVGDLREMYEERITTSSRASLWYWSQVLTVGGRFLIRRVVRRRLYRNLASHAEPTGSPSGGPKMIDFSSDVRFAFRSFHRSPGFAIAAVLVLGIGIGAVSLMFSTFNTVVLQPLPFEEPDELVWFRSDGEGGSQNSIAYLDYVNYRDGTEAFESLATFRIFARTVILTGVDEAEQLFGQFVSANLFSTLGVSPTIGRHFRPEEENVGEYAVAILSHQLWQRRFGGDPNIVGSSISLNGQPSEVVGVLPADFDFPTGTDIWFPLQPSSGYSQGRGNNNFSVVGRLREDVTIQRAQAQTDVIAGNLASSFPDTNAGWKVSLIWLHERYFGSTRNLLLMLVGIISLVPLVAGANVASLLLARTVSRRTELASRLALGASRARVIRQLMTESLVIAICGGGVGLALAYGGGEALRAFAPTALPRLDSIGIDGSVLTVTLLASLFMVPLIGMVPALRGTDMAIAETLKSGGGRGARERRSGLRSGLVVAQVALSLMLMLASGLFVRSFRELQKVNPGFQTENVLRLRTLLPYFKYETNGEMAQVWNDVYRSIEAVPGVVTVGSIDRPPPGGSGPANDVWVLGQPPASARDRIAATRRFVTEGYLDVLGIPLLAGRNLNENDRQDAPAVTVINETLARTFFPDEDPIGQTLVFNWATLVNLEVVGVVADIQEGGLGTAAPPTLYLSSLWQPRTTMHLLIKVDGDPIQSAGALRQAISDVDRDITISQVETMQTSLFAGLAQPMFRSTIVGLFALVALVLSAIGLYGVLALFVRQRSHELSVRLALGAGVGTVFAIVIKRGMLLVGLGLSIGIAGGLAGARLIESALFGVGTADPVTFFGVSLCLVSVAMVACIVPTLRAIRLDPAEVMKAE